MKHVTRIALYSAALATTIGTLSCGSDATVQLSAKTEAPLSDDQIQQKLQNERFGKAYQNLEFDFNDFLDQELGVWSSGDESRYQSYRSGYASLFSSIQIRPERLATVDWYIDTIQRNKSRYQQIEADTGVPWFWVGITHGLEASFNFSKHLHNGDPLSGRTFQVPAGRPKTGKPPFTWEFSATDAIVYKGYDAWKNWDLPSLLAYSFEKYNGFGYRSSQININSPYLWSFSNHYTKGKYTADGYYDPKAGSEQAGAMVILKRGLDRGVFQLVDSKPPLAAVKSTDRPVLNGLLFQGGSDSSDVLLLKLRLRSYGYNPGTLDKRFDSALTASVSQFQRDQDLGADGVVGNATWSLLWPSLSESNWMKAWGLADGIDLRAMRGERCIFKVASKDSPTLVSFMKGTLSARTLTFVV